MNLYKNLLVIFFAGITCGNILQAQCSEELIFMRTQAQVDSFVILYPNCTELEANILISSDPNTSDNITNLDALNQLTTIYGSLSIGSNPDLDDISGLSNLTTIGGGGLKITSNPSLTDLSVFNNLLSIGTNLQIMYNDNLINMNGFENISSLSGSLWVRENNNLTSLNGLENLTTVTGDIWFEFGGLSDLSGLENLIAVGRDVYISGTPITGLDGLDNLAFIGNNLRILGNTNLTSLSGFEDITAVNDLVIGYNYNLTDLSSLENLESVGGDLMINKNGSLPNLDGLENLTSIAGDLRILENASLTSIISLENVTSDINSLEIIDNPGLISLNGLENINSIGAGGLLIAANQLLSACNIESVCEHLENGGTATINNNATGCDSSQEVLALCTVSITTPDLTQMVISPNPTNGTFTLQGIHTGIYQVHNTSGQIIQEGNIQNDLLIDISQEAQGVYFVSITIDNEKIVRRIIKM